MRRRARPLSILLPTPFLCHAAFAFVNLLSSSILMLFHVSTDVAAELRRIFRARRAARATPKVDTQKDESMSSEGLAQALSKGRLAYFMWGLPWLLIPTQLWLSCAPPAHARARPRLLRAATHRCCPLRHNRLVNPDKPLLTLLLQFSRHWD